MAVAPLRRRGRADGAGGGRGQGTAVGDRAGGSCPARGAAAREAARTQRAHTSVGTGVRVARRERHPARGRFPAPRQRDALTRRCSDQGVALFAGVRCRVARGVDAPVLGRDQRRTATSRVGPAIVARGVRLDLRVPDLRVRAGVRAIRGSRRTARRRRGRDEQGDRGPSRERSAGRDSMNRLEDHGAIVATPKHCLVGAGGLIKRSGRGNPVAPTNPSAVAFASWDGRTTRTDHRRSTAGSRATKSFVP